MNKEQAPKPLQMLQIVVQEGRFNLDEKESIVWIVNAGGKQAGFSKRTDALKRAQELLDEFAKA
jgi:hypothetical protein